MGVSKSFENEEEEQQGFLAGDRFIIWAGDRFIQDSDGVTCAGDNF